MNIKKLIHHRAPYLMIDQVVEHSDKHLVAQTRPDGSEFYLQGHFPGSPVVPGAIMQEMTTQAGGLLITEYYSPVADYDSEVTKGWALGVLRSIHLAKYKNFARPGEELLIKVKLLEQIQNSFLFSGRIESSDQLIMFNEFTLINIEEHKLRG